MKYYRKTILRKRKPDFLRSEDYRRKFFRENKGLFHRGIYICPYCGKLMWKKKNIQIDHILAVSRVNRHPFWRWYYKKTGKDINDPNNLTASCPRCNRHKSAKGGIWIFLGHFGKYFMFPLRICVFGFILYLITHNRQAIITAFIQIIKQIRR